MIKGSILLSSCGLALALTLWPGVARADIVQPINVQLREQEPNTFLVQWSVPQTYPVQAMPEPGLPDDCRPQGERVLQEQPGTWLNRQVYRCTDAIAGREIVIRYPFVSAGQSAMIRIELLSGEQLIHALNPGEDSWSVPEVDGGLAASLWPNVRRAVLDGGRHFFSGWLHIAFWLAIALVGRGSDSLRLVGGFTLGQVVAIVSTSLFAVSLPPVLAEGGLALAVVLLASEALRPPSERRQLMVLCTVAGFVHGLGLVSVLPMPQSFVELPWLYLLLAVAGMDATLLLLVMVAIGFRRLVAGVSAAEAVLRPVAYGLGAFGVAAALALVFVGSGVEADTAAAGSRLPSMPGSEGAGALPGSRRVAAQGAQGPIQSFLSVEAFEVRHQMLFRLRDVAPALGLEGTEIVTVEAQPTVKERLQDIALPLAAVTIDGNPTNSIVDRIDFLTVGTQGVLPRPEPVAEILNEAFLGVTLIYLTSKTPETVDLEWRVFPTGIGEIPSTVSDPEFSQTQALTADSPRQGWRNNLSVDLVPTVTAMAIEPRVFPLPLVAMVVLAIAGYLVLVVARGARAATRLAWARIALAVVLVVAPLGEVALALPSALTSTPSKGEARRILAGVLPNVYRAFEFREESDAYDRLAVSVTGDTLSEVYLEHRRALEMEERGGARARVEAVEVQEVRSVTPAADGGFEADAVWVVGGTVTHFGHRHFRQNRYDARVSLVPVDDTWKIRAIELFDEERIR